MTRPRRSTNHRLAMVAANTSAIAPVPVPISRPQNTSSCQEAVMTMLPPEPSATRTRAAEMTRRIPKRSIRAAAKGATSPKSTRLMLTASDMTLVDQPNSSCSGTIRAPGAPRKPAAPSSARNATAATHHAGWTRDRWGARSSDRDAMDS